MGTGSPSLRAIGCRGEGTLGHVTTLDLGSFISRSPHSQDAPDRPQPRGILTAQQVISTLTAPVPTVTYWTSCVPTPALR